jgi:hypothetical protein
MLVDNIEIEDINPIPPIEDKDQKEVFAFYGLASYTGQCLEKGMVNFAMAYRLLDESALTEQEWSDIYDHLNKQTFGRLLNQIKSKIEIPIKIEERLNLSLKKRNWLAHDFFYDYATHFYDPTSDGIVVMLKELQDMIYLFQVTDRLIDTIYLKVWEKFGVTEEWIHKEMEEQYQEYLSVKNA